MTSKTILVHAVPTWYAETALCGETGKGPAGVHNSTMHWAHVTCLTCIQNMITQLEMKLDRKAQLRELDTLTAKAAKIFEQERSARNITTDSKEEHGN